MKYSTSESIYVKHFSIFFCTNCTWGGVKSSFTKDWNKSFFLLLNVLPCADFIYHECLLFGGFQEVKCQLFCCKTTILEGYTLSFTAIDQLDGPRDVTKLSLFNTVKNYFFGGFNGQFICWKIILVSKYHNKSKF